jgi:hypothetical protein
VLSALHGLGKAGRFLPLPSSTAGKREQNQLAKVKKQAQYQPKTIGDAYADIFHFREHTAHTVLGFAVVEGTWVRPEKAACRCVQ